MNIYSLLFIFVTLLILSPTSYGVKNNVVRKGNESASSRKGPGVITEREYTQDRKFSCSSDDVESLLTPDSESESHDGKFMSSAERRRLKNRISAKRFRQRRRDYVKELEGQIKDKEELVASLIQESQNIKKDNEKLLQLTEEQKSSILDGDLYNNRLNSRIEELMSTIESQKELIGSARIEDLLSTVEMQREKIEEIERRSQHHSSLLKELKAHNQSLLSVVDSKDARIRELEEYIAEFKRQNCNLSNDVVSPVIEDEMSFDYIYPVSGEIDSIFNEVVNV